ncbi:MAG TPA: TIGR04551 family protein [Polyangiaceae bacterium]|nr:TIGR04551 family protein [Polyangiaceae bacterium]
MQARLHALMLALLALLGASAVTAPVRAQSEGDEETTTSDVSDDGTNADEDDDDEKKPAARISPFDDVRASDWFTLSGPAFTLDGYFRVRSELFHNFNLSRRDPYGFDPTGAGTAPLWPRPPDDDYADTTGARNRIQLCGSDPTALETCKNSVQAGANMRLRLEPGIAVSDNLRVQAQIDVLDNVVLGSTPQGYGNVPGELGGYEVIARGGYYPLGSFAASAWAPQGGVNNTKDAVLVKRAWGEYMSPLGKLLFGRMPWHWGLGMVYNAGDGYDSDWQSTVDRLQFVYELSDYNLYLSATWDFANEGTTGLPLHTVQDSNPIPVDTDGDGTPDSTIPNDGIGAGVFGDGGQPYDLSKHDDLGQWAFMILYKQDEQLTRYKLAKGKPVVNTGALVVYNEQLLGQDNADDDASASIGQPVDDVRRGLVRRGYEQVTTDLWIQLLYDKLSVEMEAALMYGSLQNTLRDTDSNFDNLLDPAQDGWRIRRFGLATETKWRTLEDRLRLGFKFGYATGDDDVASIRPVTSNSSASSVEQQLTLDRTLSRFSFHPDYRVDLILFRNILTRVTSAYYFRPEVEYDFLRDPDGQRIGGSTAVIWSRASQPIQAPGHSPDLGVEFNFRLYYQLSPGQLHHDVEKMGGFFTAIDYGLLVPLDGLGYLPGQQATYATLRPEQDELDVAPAQIARWYLGVMF